MKNAFMCFLVLMSNIMTPMAPTSQNMWQPHAFKSFISRPACKICGSQVAKELRYMEGDFCSLECMVTIKKERNWFQKNLNDQDPMSDWYSTPEKKEYHDNWALLHAVTCNLCKQEQPDSVEGQVFEDFSFSSAFCKDDGLYYAMKSKALAQLTAQGKFNSVFIQKMEDEIQEKLKGLQK